MGFTHLKPWIGFAVFIALLESVRQLTAPGHIFAEMPVWAGRLLRATAFAIGFTLWHQLLTEAIRPHLRHNRKQFGP